MPSAPGGDGAGVALTVTLPAAPGADSLPSAGSLPAVPDLASTSGLLAGLI